MSGAMGFLDAIEELEPKRATGNAVGFLDFVDEDEARELEKSQREEEEWIQAALTTLTSNATLLENVVTCMGPQRDNWAYYCHALNVLFRSADSSTVLIRFWVDSEVRNTVKANTLFREDSLRIQGIASYILEHLIDWVRVKLYRPILKKVIWGNMLNSARAGASLVEGVSLSLVRAMNEGISDLPSEVVRVLTMIAHAVTARFPSVQGENAAGNFLFLHVITPVLVNPSHFKIIQEEITNRDTLVLLARIGKTVQKWVNTYSEENELLAAGVYLSSSKSLDNLSSVASDIIDSQSDSAPSSLTPTPRDSRSTPRIESARDSRDSSDDYPGKPRTLSAGESEVLKFISSVFKTDGLIQAKPKLEPFEVQDARTIIHGVLKKNYKLLNDLENAIDRNQILARHYGNSASSSHLFAAISKLGRSGDLMAQALRLFIAPENLVAPAAAAEQVITGSFQDFSRPVGSTKYSMGGARYVFFSANTWSRFSHLRFVDHQSTIYQRMVYGTMRVLGGETAQRFKPDDSKDKAWLEWTLMAFPYLALTGRGRAVMGVNSVVAQSKDFLLTVRVENSSDALVGAKKSLLGSGSINTSAGECQCFALLGFIAGWCSATVGRKIHGAELLCVGRGDKMCHFLLCDERAVSATTKKMAADLKAKNPKIWMQTWDKDSSSQPAPPSSLNSVISPREKEERASASKRASRKSSAPGIGSTDELLDLLRLSYVHDSTSSVAGVKKERSQIFKRGTLGSSKKTTMRDSKDGSAESPDRFSKGANAPLDRAKEWSAKSKPDTGENFLGDDRVVVHRAADFTVGMMKAAQVLIPPTSYTCLQCNGRIRGRALKCPSCDAPFNRRMASLPANKIRSLQSVASSLLYSFGLACGESVAKTRLTASSALSLLDQLEILRQAFFACGWGEFSFSSLTADSLDDCHVICHVRESFESTDRLGSSLDSGCPTCSTCSGIIAGFCSLIFDQRCACVETECSGSGSSLEAGLCSFVCSFPSTIVPRVKMYLAAIRQENYLDDLVGGLGVGVFDPTSLEAPTTPGSSQSKSQFIRDNF